MVLTALLCAMQPATAQFTQQGPALLGNGESGSSYQGYSVAVSGDGNTLIMGGPYDASNIGAAWIFTRSNGVWSQQGTKLVGTGSVVNSSCSGVEQGTSVALSTDGNTAIVGGPNDNGCIGAAWVFTRSGTTWNQQGSKLVGNDYAAYPHIGSSVALSADGNTAIIGALGDNSFAGAAWIFTRSNGAWGQQGSKLVGSGAYNGRDGAEQGFAVALSGDGNTAVVAAPFDGRANVALYGGVGAVWVFTRSGIIWTQQGSKLGGNDVVNGQYYYAEQGRSVAVSNDGNTLIFGGPYDNYSNGGPGAAWIFTRSNGAWSQQGSKLVGSGYVLSTGCAEANCVLQGWSVGLSSDGTTAFVGGSRDATNGAVTGAVWAFTRSCGGAWSQLGSKLVGTGASGNAQEGYAVALSNLGTTGVVGSFNDQGAWVFVRTLPTHDFNGDRCSDIAWRDSGGNVAIWLMNGNQALQGGGLGQVDPNVWKIVGQRDFDGDGKADLLWNDTSGNVAIWFMNGAQVSQYSSVASAPGWTVVGIGRFQRRR